MSKSILTRDIIYEDDDIVAINKPAGIMVHGDGRSSGPFISDWVIDKYPQAKNVGDKARDEDGNDIPRPGIVHRLDRDTSGVMLIAKTDRGFSELKKQFRDRTIQKQYVAFVWGEMEEEFGTITRAIGRSSTDFRKWSAQRGARGEMRDAETYWSKLKSFKSKVKSEDKDGKVAEKIEKFTVIEANPKTGRTHQIRVHFTALQHPIVGDSLYAESRPQALGFTRTALHAKSLEFKTCEGKKIKVEAPYPEDFERALDL